MLARVVSFEGVDGERIEQMRRDIGSQEGPPDDVPASEMILLHDADGQRATAILFFENEEDYAKGDAALNAMPAGDTPGRRTAVSKCNVAIRMEANRA